MSDSKVSLRPYIPMAEAVNWKPDPTIDALSKNQHWKDFHREAGKRRLYFDRMVKHGKGYTATAFTVSETAQKGWQSHHLADGQGKGPLEAMEAAYRASGRCDAVLDGILDLLMGRAVAVEDDFDSLFD